MDHPLRSTSVQTSVRPSTGSSNPSLLSLTAVEASEDLGVNILEAFAGGVGLCQLFHIDAGCAVTTLDGFEFF